MPRSHPGVRSAGSPTNDPMDTLTGLRIACLGDSLTVGEPGVGYFPLLEKRLKHDTLFNLGKKGDTVISLHRRLSRRLPSAPWDIALLFVGVNDVFVRTAAHYPLLKRIRRQPWASGPKDFERHYARLCGRLEVQARYLLLAPPLLIGEDIDNPWNRELEEMARRIRGIADRSPNARFVDLRSPFLARLKDRPGSALKARKPAKFFLTTLRRRGGEGIEKRKNNRSLALTIDGIHLNSDGAEIAADAFAREIGQLRRTLAPAIRGMPPKNL